MIFQQAISLTVEPLKTQDINVAMVNIVRPYYENKMLTHRTDSVYARSLIFSDDPTADVHGNNRTHVDVVVVVEAPSTFFYDQFMKSFLARGPDMPFTLVGHSYEGS
jgi:hypothetical protein